VLEFKTLLQEAKADPRVTAAEGVGVTDQDFAKAVISLSDAISQGDSAKLEPLLSKRSKDVLTKLKSSGEWTETTLGIEAVRIVYAAEPTVASDIERDQAFKTMADEQEKYLQRLYDQHIKVQSRETSLKLVEFERDKLSKTLANLKAEASGDAALGGTRPEMVILLAVQDAGGAYLLGWGGNRGGSDWTFNNASTLSLVRSRAADWDNIGMLGFSIGDGEARTSTALDMGKSGAAGDADASKPEEDKKSDPAPGGPTRRQTPAGPITVPGGG